MTDLQLYGLVIPGVALAAAGGLFSAVWSYLTARTLRVLFPRLMRATATAECVLDPATGARARALADAWSDAHGRYWASRAERDADEKRRLRAEARGRLDDAAALRAELLQALRAVLRSGEV